MNILVVYASKTGTVRDCIELLKKNLSSCTFTTVDINSGDKELIGILGYDMIIIGSPIRMNKIDKKIALFIKTNRETLLKSKTAYFLCCGFCDCFDEYAVKNIPEDLREKAVAVTCFGGRFDVSAQKGIDRLIVRMIRSNILGGVDNGDQRKDMSLPTILENNISQFAEIIRSKIKNDKI